MTVPDCQQQDVVRRRELRDLPGDKHCLCETPGQVAEYDLQRTRAGAGLPIDVLNSLDLLTRARLDLIDAATAFNIAQYQLFVALGDSPLQGQ